MKRITKILIMILYVGTTMMFQSQTISEQSNVFYETEQQAEAAKTNLDPGGGGLGGDDPVPINQHILILIVIAIILALTNKKNFRKSV